MSLRKVSDLEGLNFDQFYNDQELSNRLLDSLIEISYPAETILEDGSKTYSFKSMYTQYHDLKNNIMRTILCGDNGDDTNTCVFFYTRAFFEKTVNMLCSLYLSGNFYLNLEYTDDEIMNGERDPSRNEKSGYEVYLRASDNTLCAVEYDNTLTAEQNNNIIANEQNIIKAPLTYIKSPDDSILTEFNDSLVKFYVPVNIKGDLTVDNDVTGRFFRGIALSAYWADLAEYYEADADYDSGTLVEFSGEKEISIAKNEVNAVVSTNPAYVMNTNVYGKKMCPITLAGRVPVKILGKISKFDKIMLSDKYGIGVKWDGNIEHRVIGRALQSSDNEDVKLVECITRFEI